MPHESDEGVVDAPMPEEEPRLTRKARRAAARVLVQNAADPEQVKDARRVERDRETLWQTALEQAADNPFAQILLLHILKECSIFMSVWHDNPARMAYNSGRQDFGHWLVAEIERVPGLMQQIMAHQKE